MPTEPNKRGRKLKRPRIVDNLIRIAVHPLITNRPGIRTSFRHDGNKIEFSEEIVGEEQRLVIYVNGRRLMHFIIVDVPIKGRLKNEIPPDRNRIYYLLENGRRYRHLYLDPVSKQFGSRHTLAARYASEVG